MAKRWLLVMMIVLLYLLHQDFWYWREARPLVFGFLPIGLVYHAGFTLAVSAAMWLLIKYAWPSHLEDEGGESGTDLAAVAAPSPRRPLRSSEEAEAE